MANRPTIEIATWISGLALWGLLGAVGEAQADSTVVVGPAAGAFEALAQTSLGPELAVPPAVAAEAGLSFESDVPWVISTGYPVPLPGELVGSAAIAGSFTKVNGTAADLELSEANQPQTVVNPWAWALAYSAAVEAAAQIPDSQTVAQATATPPSPWRVEFRPYLEVPFSVNGRLQFDSVAGLGDIDVSISGNGVDSLTVTANPSVSSSSITSLSPTERAALAALARSGSQGSPASTGPTRSVQLTEIRGVDLSSVFLLGGELEVWYKDFVLALDGFYANLGSRLLFGRAGSSNPSDSVLELGIDYLRVGAALGWRAGRFPLARPEDVPPEDIFPAVTVDLFGGARYSSYGFDFVSTNTQQTDRVDTTWIEPILSTRAEFLLDQRTKLITNLYIGGFGIGDSPNFSWGGDAGLDWRFVPNVSFRPSYQFASVDWDGTEDMVSLQTHSLWLGFTFYFE